LKGWGWQAAFHPEDLPPLLEKWMKLLPSGEPDQIRRVFDAMIVFIAGFSFVPSRSATNLASPEVVRHKHRH